MLYWDLNRNCIWNTLLFSLPVLSCVIPFNTGCLVSGAGISCVISLDTIARLSTRRRRSPMAGKACCYVTFWDQCDLCLPEYPERAHRALLPFVPIAPLSAHGVLLLWSSPGGCLVRYFPWCPLHTWSGHCSAFFPSVSGTVPKYTFLQLCTYARLFSI